MYGGRNGDTISHADYRSLVELLHRAGGEECYDENHTHADSYNFSPVITTIDEQLEQLRREAEEDRSYDDNDNYDTSRINTSGGRRRRKTRKTRKTRKSARKIGKRKHMKK